MKILVIEDELMLAKEICSYLASDSIDCERVSNVKDALEKINLYQYDCIILDIGLPDRNGFVVLDELKRMKKTDGVIIISAKDSFEDKITGIRTGADDYLTKPFHLAELAARVMAIVRRLHFNGNDLIDVGGLLFNLQEQIVSFQGESLNLTPTEFKILQYFISSPNKVLSKTAISYYVLGDQSDYVDGHQLVYTHIKNLKKKFAQVGCPDFIKNVYGTGYKFLKE